MSLDILTFTEKRTYGLLCELWSAILDTFHLMLYLFALEHIITYYIAVTSRDYVLYLIVSPNSLFPPACLFSKNGLVYSSSKSVCCNV